MYKASLAAKPAANQASRTFRDLHRAFQQDASSPMVDELAAKLQTEVAAFCHEILLGNFEKKALSKIASLTYVLEPYGVELRERRLRHVDGELIFVYARITRPAEQPWAGVVVVPVSVSVSQGAAA